ncbi:amino acid adenylation domain-containing protein [uncultured Roseibium sp.]|uniref:non-ribosomal peptide synthetase n=1 Tax=uncultured Roseibium sp. TaxID=1936171 RepID=UPI00260C09CF|nr:amino acid adenylation domain-containing protein [uncultured Roseibium sp.]
MNQIQFADKHGAKNVPVVEFSRLPDVTLYESDMADTARVETRTDAAWRKAVDVLASHYPDRQPSHIALAVFAAYVARVSENSHAVFAFHDATLSSVARDFVVFEHGLAKDEIFTNVVEKVARAGLAFVSGNAAGVFSPTQCDVPLAVMTGPRPQAESGAEIQLHCDADGDIVWTHPGYVSSEAIDLIGERMTALAQGIAAAPEGALVHQPLMSARERKLVVEDWNATDRNYGYDGGLVAMMQTCAEATPDHPALIYMDETLSFAEFNARVNRLARVLMDKGVGKDKFVALVMERSLEMVIGLWATLKAGGAYVPLNTDDPSARISEIIEDCAPVAILTQDHIRERIETDVSEVIVLPAGGEVEGDIDPGNPEVVIGPNDLAYMIYTSGSTGKPKGVVVEHEAIHNRVVWMHEEYGLEPEDRVLQKTPYTFDVSVWEFLWSFSVGSTLVVAEPGGHVAISYLYGLIRRAGVTHLHFVPSVMRLFLLAPALDQLPIKKLFCSGEALGFDLVQAFYDKASDYAEVHNLYGPTEAAVDVSYFACPRDPEDKSIPIGKPVTNTGLYVLDEYDQPVPVGVPGELHIGGVQLARGYWNREDLTSERFVPCPVDDALHRRLYRTGDLAYFRPDGEIMYLGRNDFQVKINGVRMELGEIEAAIRTDEGVKDVVVVAEENQGNKILIAYVVADAADEAKADAVKDAVAAQCPVFYVPQEIRFLADMPLTVSGKVNRKVLSEQPRL